MAQCASIVAQVRLLAKAGCLTPVQSFVSIRHYLYFLFLFVISLYAFVSVAWVFDVFASEWNIISINVSKIRCASAIPFIPSDQFYFNFGLLWFKRSNSCQRKNPCSDNAELPFNRSFVKRCRDVSDENFRQCVADYYECCTTAAVVAPIRFEKDFWIFVQPNEPHNTHVLHGYDKHAYLFWFQMKNVKYDRNCVHGQTAREEHRPIDYIELA